MGFGSSRSEARQLVRHNGILVNGQRVNIPSFQINPEDAISTSDKGKEQARVQASLEMAQQRGFVDWITVDTKKSEGVFKNKPERDDLSPEINEHLVVELYSK
jgi:small subunit ribosomal protein S4